MIYGIGTDIVRVARLAEALQRHGLGFARRVLAPAEMSELAAMAPGEPVAWTAPVASRAARLLAKRFAAKEAFGKALGLGVSPPAGFQSVWVDHDARGRPLLAFDAPLQDWLAARGLTASLSLSDEEDYVVAFAVVEQQPALPAGAGVPDEGGS